MSSPLGVARPPACTGITATWCPTHGDCTCPTSVVIFWQLAAPLNDPRCPLHGTVSTHPLITWAAHDGE